MNEIIFAVLAFLALQLVLVTLIVVAKKTLLPSGEISIDVNGTNSSRPIPGANCSPPWPTRG